MIKSILVLVALLLVSPGICAQADEYSRQVSVIQSMIDDGNYRAAVGQARGLVTSSRQAQLPKVEAEALLLLGQALAADPAARLKEKTQGATYLKEAAQLFRTQRNATMLDSVGTILRVLTGTADTELPSVDKRRKNRRARLRDLPSSDSIDESALNAIVSLQEREIMSLNDSQLRQMVVLEQKDRLLDDYAFRALEDSMQLIRQEQELYLQEMRSEKEAQRRNFFILLIVALIALAGLLYARFHASRKHEERLQEQNNVIELERQRSDELLLNILPAPIAEELKLNGKANTRRYDSVTVMFADFKGFSSLAKTVSPEQLIAMLDEAFQALDRIVEKYGIEKIKTIGDAYMCAGGLPIESDDHAERAVKAALAIQEYLKTNPNFSARIGIHSGPVVAGVVGLHKFVYDIWGDTVNQASRLETAGKAGKVAISESTRALLPGSIVTEPAGTFDAKNIGMMKRYFVIPPE
ncbi:adenylate/guanylate cyclase domain-containing protein [Neolewinella antarctica]|uniref:Class 3 adenylate cyclase n=1 Tax=Neolewinella antarctica TaxID=442734 RepID=A0ABX0X626_9BACT|nr:adenylate/guanylate cyclase domain-containing protein [Neolewinella antarctica]NJC24655.1 class 3 adenylate cyclase [Neolewinella antarctica]